MQWETGDESGGTNGHGGDPAAVGFGDGQSNGHVLAGSTFNGLASIVNDKMIWFNRSDQGAPVPVPVPSVPEPQTYALMLMGLGALAMATTRRRRHGAGGRRR